LAKLVMKEREKPGKFLLPHGIILLEFGPYRIFMEDNPEGIQNQRPLGIMELSVDFGPNACIELHETQLRWFDYYLKGIHTGILEEAPVKIFVMGENVWRDEQEWPLARTHYTPYYLHSQGQANSLHGDGRLDSVVPGEEPTDRFVYDPHDPVPTCGGNTLIIPMGVQDQRQVEMRQDVLVYTSAPLTTPLEVTGPLVVTLFVASRAFRKSFTSCDH
jgi:uncharacterized protein